MAGLLSAKPLTLAFAGGSFLFLSSLTAFGVSRGTNAPVVVANGLLTIMMTVGGVALLVWAIAAATRQRRELLGVGIVAAASLFAGMAMFIIAVQPDPVPFLSILASGVLSMFLTWAFANSGSRPAEKRSRRRPGGRRLVSSSRAKE